MRFPALNGDELGRRERPAGTKIYAALAAGIIDAGKDQGNSPRGNQIAAREREIACTHVHEIHLNPAEN
jgi:hypothetical protein